MDSTLSLHLALSFAVGGAFVVACTWAAERLGPSLGGWIGGLPSTIVVGLLFIGLTSGRNAAAAATELTPIAVAINGLFLVVFAACIRRGLTIALTCSLLTWFVATAVVLRYFPRDFVIAVTSLVPLAVLMIVIVQRYPSAANDSRNDWRAARRTGRLQLVVRGLAAGIVVCSAVIGSVLAGPVLGGILAVFPAVFVTSVTTLARDHDAEFVRSFIRPLLVSGTINIAVYAAAARVLFPVAGMWAGTAGAFAFSAASGLVAFRLIAWLAGDHGRRTCFGRKG